MQLLRKRWPTVAHVIGILCLSKRAKRYGIFCLVRIPYRVRSSSDLPRNAHANSKSEEIVTAALQLYLKGAISTQSKIFGDGANPCFNCPFTVNKILRRALLLIFIYSHLSR
jgi:hypothetical protein